MRIFFDAKVVDRGPGLPIQPVSFGLVAEDGRELYVINEECLTAVLRDPWLSVNVRPALPIFDDQHTSGGFISSWNSKHEEYEHVFALEHLTTLVRDFVTSTDNAEFWSYYGSFGHVALCQLFGARHEIPANFPQFFTDLQAVINLLGYEIALPPAPAVLNHALHDARWNRDVFTVLSGEPLPEAGIKRLTL